MYRFYDHIQVSPLGCPASFSSASSSRTSSHTPRSRCWSSPGSRPGTPNSTTRIGAARTWSPASAPQFSPATVNNIGVGKVSECGGGNLVNFKYPVHQTIVFLWDTFPIHHFIWIITPEEKSFSDAKIIYFYTEVRDKLAAKIPIVFFSRDECRESFWEVACFPGWRLPSISSLFCEFYEIIIIRFIKKNLIW